MRRAAVVAISAMAVSCWLAAPSWADPSITLQLSPSNIAINGAATTATITDSEPGANASEINIASSDSGDGIGPVTTNQNGTYSATITSSADPGAVTITATDENTAISAQATLIQHGPAASVAVQLSPTSTIAANGTSTTNVIATVTDSEGDPVTGDTVSFSSSDPGNQFGAPTDDGDGTYTAAITSSTTAGAPTITATDGSASGRATLTQLGSQTVLGVGARSAVSNQPVGLLAVVSAPSGVVSGTMTFENGGVPIGGCANEPVSGSSPSASCSASFGAGSPQLSAVFTPGAGATVAGSTGTVSLTVSRDGTATSLLASIPTISIGGTATYTASVTPANQGSLTPSGSVAFLDNGQPIGQCAAQPLLSSVATCTLRYSAIGAHSISVVYSGDGNFAGSSSTPAALQVQPLGTLAATMRWSFVSTDSYTKVLTLAVSSAPLGAQVRVTCRGGGCPFARSTMVVTKRLRCSSKAKSCPAIGTLDLTSRFQKHRLRSAATITVQVVRAGWVSRVFTFVARPPGVPRTTSACLAPGALKTSACPT